MDERKMMNKALLRSLLLACISVFAAAGIAPGQTPTGDPDAARLVTSDIELFWKAFDKATPENDLFVYRDEYLAKGSEGLKAFRQMRIGTACDLAAAINGARAYYEALREPSLGIKGREESIRKSFRELKRLYPDAVFPDVYFLIGRMSSGGTITPSALLIGVDMYGANRSGITDGLGDWHRAVIQPIGHIPFIVAHELVHYQQKYPRGEMNTLLARAINEGVGDLIGEMISGGNINRHLHEYADPIEAEIWREFAAEMNGTDVSNWLYQGDRATRRPADLGYYVGYKIAENHLRNSPDKARAIKEMLEITDFKAFLTQSRYAERFQ
jgi:hypothetical protein